MNEHSALTRIGTIKKQYDLGVLKKWGGGRPPGDYQKGL
jgi:hypothetical protein